MTPSLIVNVLAGSASFLASTNFQPVKSVPLNSGLKPSSLPPAVAGRSPARTASRAASGSPVRSMRCIAVLLQQGKAVSPGRGPPWLRGPAQRLYGRAPATSIDRKRALRFAACVRHAGCAAERRRVSRFLGNGCLSPGERRRYAAQNAGPLGTRATDGGTFDGNT